ncbi:PREDICTED: protein cramped isoform X3 [Papilio polytes]|uniref:protein cramped isoform X3 n=1 Tax=Papilio polytes TaxID=76194 RepID=UPI00067623A7|nr:PREDICTED: protein cramped isoform X3 [Papilio polytes]
MPNKEVAKGTDAKVTGSPHGGAKLPLLTPKASISKAVTKEVAMVPLVVPDAVVEGERTELLGSLTTVQQQRTSARVIKKLRLEPPADKREISECETPSKDVDKEPPPFPTVKQRMPKALWSADEKSLFFEALNEYGKDFDAITSYIRAKMKKKGMPDANLKTKTQVSHFYYRTWHKLSKHVHFDENVKKVAQELYALINYGELRRKLTSVNEKTCARLGEMVRGGSMAVRARGRTLRVRTPMCRALRRLNHIAERACGARVCSRVAVWLRARCAAGWARVQAAAHNPRAIATMPLRTRLLALLRALHKRWRLADHKEDILTENGLEKLPEDTTKEEDDAERLPFGDKYEDLESHLNLQTDRVIVQEHLRDKKLALHVGPRPGAEIHLPVVSPSESLSSQKICFSSYLERMGTLKRDKDAKIRTPKRQRKDSVSEKEESKKIKVEDLELKMVHIDETAIDGIELMANYKTIKQPEEEEKVHVGDENEVKSEETAEEEEKEPERDKDMFEREKDSFSEMEDDEKFNKSDTDNESDGKGDKSGKGRKFKNLKVKFRIRPKKRGGTEYTLVQGKESEEAKNEQEQQKTEEEQKSDVDVETAIKQIRKGWSIYDAGDLTIGDLYLMFGSRSRLELDYWWAEPTPPLPQPILKSQKNIDTEKLTVNDKDKHIDKIEKGVEIEDEKEKARESDNDIFSPKNTFSQDSNDGMSGDERKNEQQASPEHKSVGSSSTLKLLSKLINRPAHAQSPHDGFALMSDRLKRLLALAGNPLAGSAAPRCACGHVCAHTQRKQQKTVGAVSAVGAVGALGGVGVAGAGRAPTTPVFRQPPPIAPRPHDTDADARPMSLEGLPRWRRGRPRGAARRVVVQRLLPLLPKLPPPSNLIPMNVPNSSPAPPKILPKPPPTSTSDLSFFYVLSESNGQFFFHDGDRRIPITPLPGNGTDEHELEDDVRDNDIKEYKMDVTETEVAKPLEPLEPLEPRAEHNQHIENTDIAQFLPSESMSLSPSRLLHAEGWMEGAVQDFSLSSFLGHLEGDEPQQEHTPPVDSQIQSLMVESSMDYVAKFADLAAEVTDEPAP